MKDQFNPVLTEIRDGARFVRSVASFVIFIFTFVMYSPSVLAIVHSETPQKKMSAKERYESSFEVKIEVLQGRLKELNQLLNEQSQDQSIQSLSWFEELKSKVTDDPLVKARLAVLEAWQALEKTKGGFEVSREELEKKYNNIKQDKLRDKVVNRIIKRQEKTLEKYTGLKEIIEGIKNADSLLSLKGQAYESLRYIVQNNPEPVAHIYNAGEMPFGVSSDASRSPYTTEEELHNYLGLEYDPGLDHANTGINIFRDFNNTPDIQKTHPDIQALADELGGNARNIYRWVYNNIYYIPSFGSIQGDVQTLHNRQGNAFDIASLLISLLRASNIPARYVYGTALLPANQINNWVGGVDDIQSARVIMAQGGIPGSAVSYGGRYEKLRFEHVWVEAWGNFGQSGAFQWNPMDAAFKQYHYTDGVDLLAEVGFDSEQFQNTLENAGVVNEDESWISNVDTTQMQSQLSQYQEAIQNYLTNLPENTTLAEVIGGQTIIEHTANDIPQLPYEEYVRTRSFAELPEKLRHYFRVELATQPGGLAGGISGGSGTTLMSFQESLPQLAGKELALSFRPATPADEAIVASLFEGVENIEDIPTELDAGLFDVIGEVTVDGEVVAATESPIDFGTVLATHKGFIDPRFGYRNTTSPITAGDYQAIGIDLQGVTGNQLLDLQSKMSTVKDAIESSQSLVGISRHELTGLILNAGIQMYFFMNDFIVKMLSKKHGLVHYRMPSFGTFSTLTQVEAFWAAANNVKIGSLAMDIDWLMSNNEGRENCWQDWVSLNRMGGQIASSLEHIVPEYLMSSLDEKVEFVSTVKAMQIANSENQKIYIVDQDNIDNVLPLVVANARVKDDIRTSVESGKIAFVHEKPIQFHDYYGTGYVLLDGSTGSGAYKISSGDNGSQLGFILGLSLAIMIPAGFIVGVAGGLPLIASIIYLLSVGAGLGSLAGMALEGSWNERCVAVGMITGFTFSLTFLNLPALQNKIVGTGNNIANIILGSLGLPTVLECAQVRLGLGGYIE